MPSFLFRSLLLAGSIFFLAGCSGNTTALSPYAPDTEEEEKTWQEILAEDPSYPGNVYLTAFVDWEPGRVGQSRRGAEYTGDSGYPLIRYTENALGPPEGGGSYTGGTGLTSPVGINGWGVWKFDPDYVILDGTGDDFVTFTKTWAWDQKADGLCCELGRVEVSENGTTWYVLSDSAVSYDTNPIPNQNNGSYTYRNVSGLHGNAPTWANFRKDMPAETLKEIDGEEEWTALEGVTVSRYFAAGEDHLGGTRFDLADFHLKEDPGKAWPSDGEMRYLKIIDDQTILDGQDYAKEWSMGTNLMAAMGINTEWAD